MALAPARRLAAIAARPMTPALISLKLLLSPGLVLLAWWLGRRFGPTIGGRTAALPVVAGPILLVLALAEGDAFAAHAARFALVGVLPLTLFGVGYAWTARRLPANLGRRYTALFSALTGWGVFITVAAAMQLGLQRVTSDSSETPLLVCIAVALTSLLVTPRLVSAVHDDHRPPRRHHLTAEVGGRALGAMALVAALTTAAAALGAAWSGLLASFPVALSVVVIAAHISDGPTSVQPIFRGYLHGLYGYMAFLALFSWSLPRLGLVWALAISWPSAPFVQCLHHLIGSRWSTKKPPIV
jgi:hypothetical protein